MGYYIIVRGPLGAGKTSIAVTLSRRLRAERISIDEVLEANHLEDDIEDGYISQRSFIKANEIAAQKANDAMDSGAIVIFDGNFYWKSQLDDLQGRLRRNGYVFTLKVPLDVCISRDGGRAKPLGIEATREVYEKTTSFEYGIDIDAAGTLEDAIDRILSFINSKDPATDITMRHT